MEKGIVPAQEPPRRADRPGSLSDSPRLSSDQIKGKERPQPPAAASLCSQKGGRPPRDSRSRGTRGGGAAATDEVLPVPAPLPARSRPWDPPVTPLNGFSGRRPSSPLRLGLKINPNTALLPSSFLPEALVTPPESFRSPRNPAAGRTLCPLHSAAGTRERPGTKQLPELLAQTQHAAPHTHRARDPPTLPAEPPRCSKHPTDPCTILPARAAGRSQAESLAVKSCRKRRSRCPAAAGPYLLPPLELAENPFEALVHVVELQRESGCVSGGGAAPSALPVLPAPPGGRLPPQRLPLGAGCSPPAPCGSQREEQAGCDSSFPVCE